MELEAEVEVAGEEAGAGSTHLGAGSTCLGRSTVASDGSVWREDVSWMDDDSILADEDLDGEEPTAPQSVLVTKLAKTLSSLLVSLFSDVVTLSGLRELSFRLSPPSPPSQACVCSSGRSLAIASSCWNASMSFCGDSSLTPSLPPTCIEPEGTRTSVVSASVRLLAEAGADVEVEAVAEVSGTCRC